MDASATDIEQAYRSYGPLVLRRCRHLLRDESKAQDAMHDVFVNLLRRKGRMHFGSPVALLLTIATRVCLNRLRGERRRPELSVDAQLLDGFAGAEPTHEHAAVAGRCLARVLEREPASTGVVATLVYVAGMGAEEAGRHVGLSLGGVRKRLRSLRERLPAGAHLAVP